MQEQLTLESVAKSLNLWRTNKSKPYSKIPQNIKDSIKSIGQHYSYKQLSKALNIYGASLTNIIKNNISPNKVDFVELSPPIISTPNPILTTNVSCTLRHPNGITMTMEISTQHLTTIIKDFLCCN